MDPITHSLSGFVIGSSINRHKTLLFILILSTLFPDIDFLLRLQSKELFLTYHRGITHGILALIIFPAILALIFRVKYGFLKVYVMSFIGYALHLLFDLTNQYGTKILSPFDSNSYALGLTFIIDPYVFLPLLIAIILSIKFKKQAKVFYLISICFLIFYVGIKAYLKTEARNFLKQKIEAQQYRVYPLPNDFLRWWFVSKYNDEYITGFVDLFSKKVYIDKRYKIINDDAISKSKESQSVKALLNIAKHPVAEVKREGNITVVTWRELSYGFLPEGRFSAHVWLKEASEGYKIINSKLTI